MHIAHAYIPTYPPTASWSRRRTTGTRRPRCRRIGKRVRQGTPSFCLFSLCPLCVSRLHVVLPRPSPSTADAHSTNTHPPLPQRPSTGRPACPSTTPRRRRSRPTSPRTGPRACSRSCGRPTCGSGRTRRRRPPRAWRGPKTPMTCSPTSPTRSGRRICRRIDGCSGRRT